MTEDMAIGEVREEEGCRVMAVEGFSCLQCDLDIGQCHLFGYCEFWKRKDKKGVVFVLTNEGVTK